MISIDSNKSNSSNSNNKMMTKRMKSVNNSLTNVRDYCSLLTI